MQQRIPLRTSRFSGNTWASGLLAGALSAAVLACNARRSRDAADTAGYLAHRAPGDWNQRETLRGGGPSVNVAGVGLLVLAASSLVWATWLGARRRAGWQPPRRGR
jgi:hypothetical protein